MRGHRLSVVAAIGVTVSVLAVAAAEHSGAGGVMPMLIGAAMGGVAIACACRVIR